MPDSRRHRGPHPEDAELFSADALPLLRAAVRDLSWLRSRGYADPSAMKIVGDRYQLRARQRVAVGRCACADDPLASRLNRRVPEGEVRGHSLVIDGLNVLTTIEVALAGGALLLGRDGCLRDMASFHGNYRLVHETGGAVSRLLDVVERLRPAEVTILIDRPVSNSGRLAATIRDDAASRVIPIDALATDGVDESLRASKAIVATADSAILDGCGSWLNLARLVVEAHRSELGKLWLLDFEQAS